MLPVTTEAPRKSHGNAKLPPVARSGRWRSPLQHLPFEWSTKPFAPEARSVPRRLLHRISAPHSRGSTRAFLNCCIGLQSTCYCKPLLSVRPGFPALPQFPALLVSFLSSIDPKVTAISHFLSACIGMIAFAGPPVHPQLCHSCSNVASRPTSHFRTQHHVSGFGTCNL